jgi:branched-subunit amino acid ABC-type transport system permease component
MPEFSFIFVQFLNGLSQAMVLFLIASGLSLIFGVLGVLNFAHGSLYMLGAYFAYTVVSLLQNTASTFWIAVLVAPVAVALVGGAIESLLLRRLYHREHLYQLLFTYAIVLIVSDAVKFAWGTDNLSISRPPQFASAIKIFSRYFATYDLFLLVVGPCIAAVLWYILNRTTWGRTIRAAASDRETLEALGVDVHKLFTMVFILGSWLGGLGGALAAPRASLYPGMDVEIIVESFIVVVIGGMGSLWGTVLGAFILGQVNAFGILFLPRLAMVFIYALMTLVLIVRPWGLLGKPIIHAR